MSPNSTPPDGLYGRETAQEAPEAVRDVDAENAAQAGADGFDGPEIHTWDAAKTAEVTRILAEHPPRKAGWTTSNVDHPEAPMPTPAEHCGRTESHPAHKTMRGRKVFQCPGNEMRHMVDVQGRCPACGKASLFLGDGGYVTCRRLECPEPDAASTLLERDTRQPAPADVRDQIAAAIYEWSCQPHRWENAHPDDLAAYRADADAVLRVPAIAEALTAEAAVERVRKLCDLTIRYSVRRDAIDQAQDTLAAIDQQESTECPPGVHSIFDPCPGFCGKPLDDQQEQQ